MKPLEHFSTETSAVQQKPTFYDSSQPDSSNPGSPIVEVKVKSVRFRFFKDTDFFGKFAQYLPTGEARGIPVEDLGDMVYSQLRVLYAIIPAFIAYCHAYALFECFLA